MRRVGLILMMLTLPACSVLDSRYQATLDDGSLGAVVTADFSGNNAISSAELRREIEDYLYDLSRDPSREAMAFDARDAIVDRYVSAGYRWASVLGFSFVVLQVLLLIVYGRETGIQPVSMAVLAGLALLQLPYGLMLVTVLLARKPRVAALEGMCFLL